MDSADKTKHSRSAGLNGSARGLAKGQKKMEGNDLVVVLAGGRWTLMNRLCVCVVVGNEQCLD